MSNKKIQLLAILFVCLSATIIQAENKDAIYAEFEANAVSSTGNYAPFLLQSNKNGTVSHLPHSGTLQIEMGKNMNNHDRLIDYGFGIAALGMMDTKGFTTFMPKLFAAARFYIFDATIGICPTTFGNEDKELSSGGLIFSNNARAIPRATVGIREYRPIPYTWGYAEIKGGLTHAWFDDNVYINKGFLHHKFIGGKLGGRLPVNISYEFHHAAQWGGYSPIYDDLGNDFNAFLNTFLAQSGGSMANDQLNAQGNHIGSQQMGLDIKIKGWKLTAYWQTIFEDGPIKKPWNSMNYPDGLWGCAISQTHFPFINKIVYEYINTSDQSGPSHDKDGLVFGGADSYFMNSIYQNGWNYHLRTIGTPFITSPIYNTDGTIHTTNNRTQTHYVALKGNTQGYYYKARLSNTKNYGTYGAPYKSQNTSFVLEIEKTIKKAWGMDLGLALGTNWGTQLGNTVGIMFSAKKRFEIITY